jgi:hypothetical protein
MIRSPPPSARARSRKKTGGGLTWIKPASPSPPDNCHRTGVSEPTGFARGSAPEWVEALMREFLAAAAISAIIIGVMLGIG